MRFGFFVLALVAIASPASANWQYTRWGMTPDQVTAHESMTRIDDPSTRGSVNGDKILLEAPYSTGTFNFTAGFGFDSANHLDRVRLVLDSGDAAELRAILLKKYGEPKQKDSDFDAFGGRITWITSDETIILSQGSGNEPGVTPNVSLDYSQRSSASDQGL